MKRDLKINYGILDDIINQLSIYKKSLQDMESSLSTITTYVEQNHGDSIEAWKERMKGTKDQMIEYETQINDLLDLFQGYVNDTTAYITPLQRNAMMRVDRNDIYWNLKQIESGIDNNVPKAMYRTYNSPPFWGSWGDVTDEEKYASSVNKSKIASIRSDIQQTNSSLIHKMDRLWDIYNSKVKKFENTDDEYNTKAGILHRKYTNFWEDLWDFTEGVGKFTWDLVTGLLKGLADILVGALTLVVDAGIVAVSNQVPDIIEPKFLKDAANERINNYTAMVQQIVEDPFSVVEGITQSFSDSVEEDGIVLATGSFAAGFIPLVGWSKYAKIGKVIEPDKPKKAVNNTAKKEGKTVDPVEVLLENAKRVAIEFTHGVIGGMRILKEILEGRNVNFALDGGPGSGNVFKVFDDSDDTLRRADVERVYKNKEVHRSEIDEVIKNDYDIDGNLINRSIVPKGYESVEDFLKVVDDNTIKEYGYESVEEFKAVVGHVDEYLNESPKNNIVNKGLAGGKHVKGVDYDVLGFPIFKGDNVKFSLKLDEKLYKVTDDKQFKECTRILREAIEKGEVSKDLFSEKQIRDIENGEARIKGLTWHHHQVPGKIQLVVSKIHKVNHLGGNKLWGDGIR